MAERQFGPYRLVHQIATGGMAEIHLAKTRGIGGFEKYIALKMIHPNFSMDEHFIEMLIDEAKISVQLQHVNIAQIFDLGRVGDTYYIAMEYVDGCDLYKLLRKASEQDVPMPIDVALLVAKEVCAGLDYAHRKRDAEGNQLLIVHRDISPQNVLLSNVGEVKIVDFGIAKATSRVRQTAVGVIKGKYYYMSPEQAWGDPVDHRTDIFSAAILLYEMLTGQMLYLEDDMHKLLDMVRKADIAPPSRKRRDVPAELDRIVMRGLAKRPEQRWQTAHDFGTALEHFLHAFAPEASAQRLAAFMERILSEVTPAPIPEPVLEPAQGVRRVKLPGPPPPAPPRAPSPAARITRGLERDALMSRDEFTDENSIIFKMADMARGPRARGPAGERVSTDGGSETVPVRSPIRPISPVTPTAKRPPTARTPHPRMADAHTPHVPLPEDQDEATVISGPPGFDEPAGDPLASAEWGHFDDPALDTGDRTGDRSLSPQWDHDADFSSAQPTVAEKGTRGFPPPGPARRPSVDESDDDPTGTHELKGSKGAPHGKAAEDPVRDFAAPMDDELDPDDVRPTQRLKGAAVVPPALAGRNPTPAISAIAPPRPSRRTPIAVPQVHSPPDAPPARPAARPPAPPPTPGGSAPVVVGQPPSGAPAPPRPEPPSAPVAPAPAVPLRPPLVAPPSGPVPQQAGVELPLSAPMDTPVPFRLPSAPPIAPAGPAQPPTPSPAPLWARDDGGFALPDIDDPAYRLPSVKPDRKKLWLIIGGLIALVGVAAIVFAVISRGGDAKPTKGSMEVISLPAGASVELDGRGAGKTPLVIENLAVGQKLKLRLTLAKHDPWEREETVSGATRVKVIAQLKEIRGTLKVESRPSGAEVLLGNQSLGVTPLERTDLDPFVDGTLELRKQGYRPKREPLSWKGERSVSLVLDLEPTR